MRRWHIDFTYEHGTPARVAMTLLLAAPTEEDAINTVCVLTGLRPENMRVAERASERVLGQGLDDVL